MQTVDAEGPLSPAEVWERYTHASRWSSWAPQVRGVSGAHDPVRAGDRGWVRGPFPLRVPYTVLAVDEAELEREVDQNWDPPVTAGQRLVSIQGDCLQHLGQAAYVAGLLGPRTS